MNSRKSLKSKKSGRERHNSVGRDFSLEIKKLRRSDLMKSIIIILFMVLSATASTGSPAAAAEPISFFQDRVEKFIGEYPNDKRAAYTLQLHNPGDKPVTALSIKTSCGCTVARPKKTTVLPGETVDVRVTVDMTGKRGKIKKGLTVRYEYDGKPKTMIVAIALEALLIIPEHESRSLDDKLFGPKCGRCHAVPAKGKQGAQLFRAVCGYCHGMNAEGASAMGFNNAKYLKSFDRKKADRIIRKGTGNNRMPGFSTEKNGPLSDEQIESLIMYFEDKKHQWDDMMP